MAKISVIIPVTQEANHIDELLSTLLVQSEKDIEIICSVAKNSEYMPLLENYSIFDSRIKLLKLENEQQWLSASVEAATADFVIFLRTATVMVTAFLEYLLKLVNSCENVDFVYAPLAFKDELFFQTYPLSSVSVEDFLSQNTEGYFTPKEMGKNFLQKADKQIFGKLIRRDFLQNLISRQSFTNDETVLFYNCLFKARIIVYTLKELVFEWHFSDPFLPQSYRVKEENIKISVVVPVYNAEQYLAKCLDSLMLQTYHNLEFICINDGSTDGSEKILEQYATKDNRFKIITQENKGISTARNVGLKEANGDYVSIIDDDDIVSLALYQKFVAIVQHEKRQIDLFQFNGLRFFDAACLNPFWIYVMYYITDWGDFYEGHFKGFDAHVNISDNIVWNKIYRNKWLRENDITFPDGYIFEDRIFALKAHIKAQNKYLLENYLYFYRQHSSSVTTNMGEKAFDVFEILKREEELLKEVGIYEEYKYMFFQFNILEYWIMLLLIKSELKDSFLQTLRERLQSLFVKLDENICRLGSYMEKYDDLMNLPLEQILIKYKDAPYLFNIR